MPLFTKDELEELRRADEELEEGFTLTQEDWNFSRRMDREAKLDALDNRGRRKAARSAAYYEANKDKIAENRRSYYKANREKWNAYLREYRRRKREEKKNTASPVCETGKAADNI